MIDGGKSILAYFLQGEERKHIILYTACLLHVYIMLCAYYIQYTFMLCIADFILNVITTIMDFSVVSACRPRGPVGGETTRNLA